MKLKYLIVEKINSFIEIDKNRTKLIEQKNKLEALIFSIEKNGWMANIQKNI